MKFQTTKNELIEVKTLHVQAHVRYWEDGSVNGVDDEDGKLIPFKSGEMWNPVIDIDTGRIIDWPQGLEADIHYKVCDEGIYTLRGESGKSVAEIDGYVPSCLSLGGDGWGDYIIMKIDGKGIIQKWNPDFEELNED